MSYGCFNRTPLRGHCTYGVNWSEGNPLTALRIEHPHVMTKNCQYTLSPLGAIDKDCAGCLHQSKALEAQAVT